MSTRGEIINFPTQYHIGHYCQPGNGDKTCRYLILGAEGFKCAKFSGLRQILDERVKKGTMYAKGDNCGGILDIIILNKSELRGNKAIYEESSPSYKLEGVFEDITLQKGIIEIVLIVPISKLAPKGKCYSSINSEFLDIEVSPKYITFSISGIGNFGGVTKVIL